MSHSHDVEVEIRKPLRRLVLVVTGIMVALTGLGLLLLWPSGEVEKTAVGEFVAGEVLNVTPCADVPDCVDLLIEVSEGTSAGQTLTTSFTTGESEPEVVPGTEVWLVESRPGSGEYGFSDIRRDRSLIWLAVVFSVAVVLFARWKGLAALAGLVSSLVLLAWFVLPALVLGQPPIAVAAVGAGAIAIVSMGFAHGFHTRTAVALIGTLIALALTLGLGVLFTETVTLTGMGDENAFFLEMQGLGFDLRGLFLAGLVIGALGVLDDVTVTQTAAVAEVKAADPQSSFLTLFRSGMRVGRDHVAATVNTLVLAYVGASLPLALLLTMSDAPMMNSLNSQALAQEVVRALVGGLGIIAAVPITTALMAAVLTESGRGTGSGPAQRKGQEVPSAGSSGNGGRSAAEGSGEGSHPEASTELASEIVGTNPEDTTPDPVEDHRFWSRDR